MVRWGTYLLPLVVACGCGDNLNPTFLDAGPGTDGSMTVDASAVLDGAPPLAWLDFSASGCIVGGGQVCTGTAPLVLNFHALAPSPIDAYRWRFGDLDPEDPPIEDAIPTHTFALPGSYDVSLTASGPGGSNIANKVGYVVVEEARVGLPCSSDAQCANGECVCAGETCPPQLGTGICAERCPANSCEDGVCADLRPASQTEDWHDKLCVADCSADGCPGPLTCQSLLGAPSGWVRGCFGASIVEPVGGSCVDSDGAPNHDRCASALCLAEGARGLCSADCATTADCPDGATCATFGGSLGKKCLARCSADVSCDADPWLACEDPGFTADKGFTVDETPSGGGYCAPKRCTTPAECGPDGTCTDDYCGPLP